MLMSLAAQFLARSGQPAPFSVKAPIGGFAALSLLLLALSTALPAGSQEIVFRFAPPDGARYTVVRAQASNDIIGQGARTDEAVVKIKTDYRRTEKGYGVEEAALSLTRLVNGKKNTDPIVAAADSAVVKSPFSLDIAPDGRLRGVSGIDGYLQSVRKGLPTKLSKQLAAAVDSDTLLQRVSSDWRWRVESLAGRRVKIGESFAFDVDLDVGSETIAPCRVTMTLKEMVFREGRRLVRLTYTYEALPDRLKLILEDAFGKSLALQGAPEGISFTVTRADAAGTGSRLVDPATLLSYEENVVSTVDANLSVPGQAQLTLALRGSTVTESGDQPPSPEPPSAAPMTKPKPAAKSTPASKAKAKVKAKSKKTTVTKPRPRSNR